ncbi:hypothetical protein [Mesorhizobium abyssinicae]|uniref:hypothetical protein n=1 Tax=Mesorhizobium abyssinicae TaxID=1209958 RepID=UPI0033951F14
METAHLNFESFDGRLRRAAEDALGSLRELGKAKKRVPVTLDPQIASVLARFLNTALERSGVAYGPLGTELSPSQAGKILGLSSDERWAAAIPLCRHSQALHPR